MLSTILRPIARTTPNVTINQASGLVSGSSGVAQAFIRAIGGTQPPVEV